MVKALNAQWPRHGLSSELPNCQGIDSPVMAQTAQSSGYGLPHSQGIGCISKQGLLNAQGIDCRSSHELALLFLWKTWAGFNWGDRSTPRRTKSHVISPGKPKWRLLKAQHDEESTIDFTNSPCMSCIFFS